MDYKIDMAYLFFNRDIGLDHVDVFEAQLKEFLKQFDFVDLGSVVCGDSSWILGRDTDG